MRGTIALALALALLAGEVEAKKPAREARPKRAKAPDYYPLPDGATWRYEFEAQTGKGGFSNKVVGFRKEEGGTLIDVELTAQSGQVTHQIYSKPAGWVLVHRQEFTGQQVPPMVFAPPRQMLKNPLKAGDTWKWSGTGMGGIRIEEQNSVDGEEVVKVPAGTFKTMKVSTSIVQGGQPVNKQWWFAPGVGMVRSMTDTGASKSTSELVESSLVPKR